MTQEAQPYKFADPKFIGQHTILTESAEITRDSSSGKLLNFYAYERCGLTVYKDKGPPYQPEEMLEPVHDPNGLKKGDKLLVPNPLGGGYWSITVEEIKGMDGYAKGEEITVSLHYDQGHPQAGIAAEWVAQSMGCVKGLARIDFA